MYFLSLEILIGLFSRVSAKPAHLASFGYVFPWWTVILVMETASRHSISPCCCWNDQPIGFPTEGGKQCGSCHQSYQVNITTLSGWGGVLFLVSWFVPFQMRLYILWCFWLPCTK